MVVLLESTMVFPYVKNYSLLREDFCVLILFSFGKFSMALVPCLLRVYFKSLLVISHVVIPSRFMSLGLDLMLDIGFCLYVLFISGTHSRVKLC